MLYGPLLLASASPRRRDLLTEAQIAFEIAPVDVEELDGNSAPNLNPAQLAEANAKRKAAAAWRTERWVLGADTVVALGSRLFGKPGSKEEAAEFLRALSGRTHEVVTGCALIGPDRQMDIFHDVSRVTFRVLDERMIADYLDRVDVLDKAGGYALQEHGETIVERVEGSRSNIIGLPIEALRQRWPRAGDGG